jgi:hypothetical protein
MGSVTPDASAGAWAAPAVASSSTPDCGTAANIVVSSGALGIALEDVGGISLLLPLFPSAAERRALAGAVDQRQLFAICRAYKSLEESVHISIETLILIERMALGVGAIFWFTSHTMLCQPERLGIHIYS